MGLRRALKAWAKPINSLSKPQHPVTARINLEPLEAQNLSGVNRPRAFTSHNIRHDTKKLHVDTQQEYISIFSDHLHQ